MIYPQYTVYVYNMQLLYVKLVYNQKCVGKEYFKGYSHKILEGRK